MKYRNKKTGAIIDVAFAIKGDNWEPVGATKKAEPIIEEKPVEVEEYPNEETIEVADEVIEEVKEPVEEPIEIAEEESKPKKTRKTRSKKK